MQSNQSGQTRENRKNYSGDRKDEKSKKTFMDALQLKTIMKGPSEKAALSDVVRNKQNKQALLKLVRFTVAMMTLPFLTLFALMEFFEEDEFGSHVTYAGLGAVCVVFSLTAIYVLAAFNEKDTP